MIAGQRQLNLWVGDVREKVCRDGSPRAPQGGHVATVPPQVPMTKHILCNWMSTTKPVAVVAIAQMWERRLLGLSEPVARCARVAARGRLPRACRPADQPWHCSLTRLC